ncbi:MAG: ribosome biogenesis GTPase YlqF [Desulfotomaculaceae bacterium]|nr:ribosome biogenesis GTPase YlqF [Desulfotomaculaceae bacterium]
MNIQWYPGHMAKARRLVKENLKLVDVVIEILDARIPASSRNQEIGGLTGQKPRLVVLNKSDLADPLLTGQWEKYFSIEGYHAVAVNSLSGRGLKGVPGHVRRLAVEGKVESRPSFGGRSRAPRCMVVGIPNVGKSLFINKLAGRRAARVEDRPGITRGPQWIRVAGNIDLMDMPGILWPKLDDQEVAFRLAATGAIREEVFDLIAVAGKLMKWLTEYYPAAIQKRYKLEDLPADPLEMLEAIGMKRGFVRSGGVIDIFQSAQVVLKEFREGRLGRFTLDRPEL